MCEKCKHNPTECEDLFMKDEGDDEGDYTENEDLDDLEESEDYSDFQDTTKKALHDQRKDLILAGVIWTVYNGLGKDVLERLQNGEATKADTKTLVEYIGGQAIKRINSIGTEEFKNNFNQYILTVSGKAGQSIYNQVGLVAEYKVNSQILERVLAERSNLMMKGLDETTARRFAQNIVTGMKNGYSMSRLTTEMKKIGTAMSEERALLITRTETNAALQFVRKEVAKSLGATKKIWRVTSDERTCSVCHGMEGEEVNINDGFSSGAEIPPTHSSCRCRAEFVFGNGYEEVEGGD